MKNKYKVHKLKLDLDKEYHILERYLNSLKGEVISITTDVRPFFLFYGARIKSITIIEKVKK